jgi:hypothetical protein
MKKILLVLCAIIVFGCQKENSTFQNSQNDCKIENKGIYISDGTDKINTFKIDSVVLTANVFKLWFTEDGSNTKFIATLKRYDQKALTTGSYYILDSTNSNFGPPYNSSSPAVFFDVKSIGTTTNAFYLYEMYPACISNKDGKFGILIEGMKAADTRTGNPSVLLTVSLLNQEIKFK